MHTGHRGGFVWPILLIGLGVLFLLNNLGLLDWGVWPSIWRLWPVLLVAIGLEILFGRGSIIGSLLSAVVIIGALILGVWYFTGQGPIGGPTVEQSVSQPLHGADRADVTVEFAMGRLRLEGMSRSDVLAEGTVTVPEGQRLQPEFRVQDGTAHLVLADRGRVAMPAVVDAGADRRLDLRLTTAVPMELQVRTGVGTADLDLADLTLTALDINTGVGKTEVRLPGRGRLSASVEGGVGETRVVLPRDVPARIRRETGLGNVEVQGDYRRDGDEYTSPNFGAGDRSIDLRVKTGVGRIVVRQE